MFLLWFGICHEPLRLRYRNVTICPRVQELAGENAVADVPVVMPFSLAQRTALKNQSDDLMSLNGFSVLEGSGDPAVRHRNVTHWARVQEALGENVVDDVPVVMPLAAAQYTGV